MYIFICPDHDITQDKKLSGFHVQPKLGFYQTWAEFGWPVSDDQLLFAAQYLVIIIIDNDPICYFPDCDIQRRASDFHYRDGNIL